MSLHCASDSDSDSDSQSINNSSEHNLFDSLIEDINKLTLNPEIKYLNSHLNMANPQVNQVVQAAFKSEYLQMVPEFNGDQNNLNDFIQNCELIIAQFYQANNPNNFQNKYIINCLKNKITGKAKIDISTYTIDNWQDLRAALLATYADKRDLQTLTIELCELHQNKLTPMEFFNKIQANLNLQIAYCNNNFNQAKATFSIENSLSLGLRIFLKNLNKPLGDYVTTRNPNSMQEALNILVNDFQINDKIKSFNSQTKLQFNKPLNSQAPIRFSNNYNQQQNSNFNPNYNSNQNVFKPKPNFIPQYKPTPMSVSTRNTFKPSVQNRQVYRHPQQQRQNFIAEELHNCEEPSYFDPNSGSFDLCYEEQIEEAVDESQAVIENENHFLGQTASENLNI